MKLFFSTLPRNIIECFKGRMLLWHLTAILLTFGLVVSGLDWQYFLGTRSTTLRSLLFPRCPYRSTFADCSAAHAACLGYCHPKSPDPAECLGHQPGGGNRWYRRSRIQSAHWSCPSGLHVGTDLTHVFKFGLLRGGVFWGWPSSHTTIAFAMAVTVFRLCPKQRWLGHLAIGYALYIGLGVSMTIHWFSDFAAGALIGTVVGIVVATSFSGRQMCLNAQADHSEQGRQ